MTAFIFILFGTTLFLMGALTSAWIYKSRVKILGQEIEKLKEQKVQSFRTLINRRSPVMYLRNIGKLSKAEKKINLDETKVKSEIDEMLRDIEGN